MKYTYHPSHHTRTSFFPSSDMINQFCYVWSYSEQSFRCNWPKLRNNNSLNRKKNALNFGLGDKKFSRQMESSYFRFTNKKFNANGSLKLDFVLHYAGFFSLSCSLVLAAYCFSYVNNANSIWIELFRQLSLNSRHTMCLFFTEKKNLFLFQFQSFYEMKNEVARTD